MADEEIGNRWRSVPDDELLYVLERSSIIRRYEGLNDKVSELIRRYKNKKDECEELRNAHNSVLEELNNKKKECEELESEVAAYRDQTGD